MRTVFLTGGTGFIGKELVKELAKEQVTILLLVRSKSKATRIYQERGLLNEAVMHFIEGDLTKIDLGLSAEDREWVLKTDVIIHAGGTHGYSSDKQRGCFRIFEWCQTY